jgi:hypothetical protein
MGEAGIAAINESKKKSDQAKKAAAEEGDED